MGIIAILLLAVGLSMDAFAVSLCKGMAMKAFNRRQACILGLYFGGFQALMPLLGWLVGGSFSDYIVAVDHWIAFALLAFIGGKMIYEAYTPVPVEELAELKMDVKELLVLSVATSIDALAVGVALAFDTQTNIPLTIILIGIVTFAFSVMGAFIGNKFGNAFRSKAEILGGLILIGIGVKILVEHLFFA